MRGTLIRDIWRGVRKLLRDQRGNAMMLTAAAIVPVIGIVGSGIDIGRGYMAELRLQQACDAGVLAGRRYMGVSSYGDKAEAEASKMFDFNYPAGFYGSESVSFSSEPEGTSDVKGTATARVPTSIMYIFGVDNFNLSVDCAAKLEISNLDIMLVLDVTGSMKDPGTGTQARIDELKEASMTFFDTLTTAEKGDGRLRIGVVPYSSTVNVGKILVDENPAWIADTVTMPSRQIEANNWQTGTTVNGTASDGAAAMVIDWANMNPVQTVSNKNATTCPQTSGGANSTATTYQSQTTTQTSQTINSNGERVTTNDLKQKYRYLEYRYRWTSPNCYKQSRTMEYTRTTPQTITQPPTRYNYLNRTFNVASAKSGGALVTSTGTNGTNETNYWSGCIFERKTVYFAANATAPSTAQDMDIDSAPGTSDDSRWKAMIPEIAYARAQAVSSKPSTTGTLNVNVGNVSGTNYGSYKVNWPNGWGVCPAAAMKLTEFEASDRSTFDTYIKSLQPVGGTYHDVGMVWGARLLSPTGLFKDENATAENGRPIDRHIIFMTDGVMSANMGNLTFQGYEYLNQNVSGSIDTSDATLTSLHNNRFGQLCAAARGKNITVWVVALSVNLNTSLTNCATPGKAYQTLVKADGTKVTLKDIFSSIAGQISRLRLSQ
ncbi:MAG: TadE/TadG family protein [Sphingopyxis sp.]|nr:TadE/TadG family protein [Sphingopyxis sp.]